MRREHQVHSDLDVEGPDAVMLCEWEGLEGGVECAAGAGDDALIGQELQIVGPDAGHLVHEDLCRWRVRQMAHSRGSPTSARSKQLLASFLAGSSGLTPFTSLRRSFRYLYHSL